MLKLLVEKKTIKTTQLFQQNNRIFRPENKTNRKFCVKLEKLRIPYRRFWISELDSTIQKQQKINRTSLGRVLMQILNVFCSVQMHRATTTLYALSCTWHNLLCVSYARCWIWILQKAPVLVQVHSHDIIELISGYLSFYINLFWAEFRLCPVDKKSKFNHKVLVMHVFACNIFIVQDFSEFSHKVSINDWIS